MVTVEWTPDEGWHDARVTPYGPLTLDPATAVLHYAQEIFEGMKAYRHADGSIWTFRPEANAARMVRSASGSRCPVLARATSSQAVDALVAVDQRWVPDAGGREEPLPAAVHVRLRGVPRRAARPARHLHGDRLPGRRLLQGRRQAGLALALRATTPAPAAAAWARPRPAATTPRSLVAQQEAIDARLRPGRLPRRARRAGTSRSSAA